MEATEKARQDAMETTEKAIQDAINAAHLFMQDEENRLAYIKREMEIMDYESHMNAFREEGREEGEIKLGRLISMLLKDGKIKDAQDAAVNAEKRQELYAKYNFT